MANAQTFIHDGKDCVVVKHGMSVRQIQHHIVPVAELSDLRRSIVSGDELWIELMEKYPKAKGHDIEFGPDIVDPDEHVWCEDEPHGFDSDDLLAEQPRLRMALAAVRNLEYHGYDFDGGIRVSWHPEEMSDVEIIKEIEDQMEWEEEIPLAEITTISRGHFVYDGHLDPIDRRPVRKDARR